MKSIYLIRHGEIPSSKPRRFIGKTELPLTECGRQQIGHLGKTLSEQSFDRLICSPLGRCQESGEILSNTFTIPVETANEFSEIDLGDWEGLTVGEVKLTFPGEYERRGADLAGFRPRGGESFGDVYNRAWPALMEVVETTKTTSVIVAHAGVNRVLLCHLLGLPFENMFRLPQDYGCYNIVLADNKGIRVGSINNVVGK